jgi:MFS family permease
MYRPVVSATIADIVPSEDRPRAYSLLYWAVNLGASVAPPVGGYLAATSYPVLFAADGATTVLYGVMLWLALPETRPSDSLGSGEGLAEGAVLRDRLFLTICLLAFALHVVFFQAFVALPIDMRAHGISTAVFGGLMAINPVLIVLLQPWAGELIRDRSRATVMALASLLMGLGFGMNAWAGSAPAYAGCIALFTLGEILFAPAAISLVADLAPAHMRGGYQGTFSIAFTAAFVAAPVIGGYLMTTVGARWLWVACLTTGCSVAAGFVLLRGAASRQMSSIDNRATVSPPA